MNGLDRAPANLPAVAATGTRPRLLRELLLLLGLYVVYSVARLLADADLATATSNASALLRVEGALLLDVEREVNEALTALPLLAVISGYWYSLLHYVVTPAVLIWVWRSRAAHYRRVRNALVAGSALGLAGFALVPMAPPRMLPGYVDTLAATSRYGWWGSDASAPRGLGALTNELAAMPSLHVGWALWVAWVVLRVVDNRTVRVVALAYAALTTLVVVATANHYLLDAVGGAVVIAAGVVIAARIPVPGPDRRSAPVHGRPAGSPCGRLPCTA